MSQLPPVVREPAPRTNFATILLLILLANLFFRWLDRTTQRLFNPAAESRPVTARGDLAEDEKSTIELFKKASPGVVHITTASLRRDALNMRVTAIPEGTGSGFIWDSQGYIVTNFHVVADAKVFRVALADSSVWDGTIVGVAPEKDLAVLKIGAPPEKLHPITVGTSDDLQVGQKVFAIGNPFGLDQTLTSGIISGLGREIESKVGTPIAGVIQTDAAINPGNSGGPLLDSAGRLIGVNTAIASPSGASSGVGFAVPVDIVQRLVPQLIRTGKVVRAGMGIGIAEDVVAKKLGVKEGVLIASVRAGSAAEKAGIKPTLVDEDSGEIVLGDVIVRLDDLPVVNSRDLYRLLDQRQVNDTVQVTIQRGNTRKKLTVTLQELP